MTNERFKEILLSIEPNGQYVYESLVELKKFPPHIKGDNICVTVQEVISKVTQLLTEEEYKEFNKKALSYVKFSGETEV